MNSVFSARPTTAAAARRRPDKTDGAGADKKDVMQEDRRSPMRAT